MHACKEKYNPEEIIDVLIKHGANPKNKCNEGKTVFDYAQENTTITNEDGLIEKIEALLGGFEQK